MFSTTYYRNQARCASRCVSGRSRDRENNCPEKDWRSSGCLRARLISVINSTGSSADRGFPPFWLKRPIEPLEYFQFPLWAILSATLITVNARAARFDWHRERRRKQRTTRGFSSFAKYTGPGVHQTVAGSFSLDSSFLVSASFDSWLSEIDHRRPVKDTVS